MIDIPRGSVPPPAASNSSATSASSSSSATTQVASAAEIAASTVADAVEAVVLETKARQASGNLEKPAWDILLKLNPNAVSTGTPQTSLSPDQLRLLQSGQALLVRTTASFPLPTDTRLQVSVGVDQGIRILLVIPPTTTVPLQLFSLIKQWAPAQQSLQPLLANVQQLLSATSVNTLASLPAPVQTSLQQLLQTLPDAAHVQQPGQLRAAVENSGLLLEARLARLVAALGSQGKENGAASSSDSTVRSPASALATLTRLVRDGLQRLTPDNQSTDDAGTTPTKPLQTLPLDNALGRDLKLALQKLETALREAQPAATQPTAPTSGSSNASASAGTSDPPDFSPDTLPSGNRTGAANTPTEGDTPEQALAKLAVQREQTVANASNTTQRPALHPGIQHYSASAREARGPESTIRPNSPEAILLPPLPGQVLVQAQPRSKPSLKGDEMADAIVNTLLKQVRGALARTTLHQLTSSGHKQDSSTPPLLSFEVPFLHNGQADLFQFRIHEETGGGEERRDAQLAKRWQVQLGFDIEGLGPMFCQLSLTGNSMAVNFWAAWETTLAQTKSHFDFLEQSLTKMGIHVEKMQGHLGMPENDRTGVRNQLVDITT